MDIKAQQPMVWVLKEQVRRTALGHEAMDYSGAMQFGELKFVTEIDPPLHGKGSLTDLWLKQVLEFCDKYDEARDYIVATGQPTAIFMIAHTLAQYMKTPRFLVWKRETNTYVVFSQLQ